MSMHLEGPWLSTTGRRRGKQKFRNADVARRERELQDQWNQKLKEWAALSPNFSKGSQATAKVKLSTNKPAVVVDPRRSTKHIPSVDTGGQHLTGRASKQYTGTKVLGIATMHKSNAVPVFAAEDAVEISQMRRN